MPHHLAILTDFPEEGWPSMDLCGDMLLAHLPRNGPRPWGLPPLPAVSPEQPSYRWSQNAGPYASRSGWRPG